MARKYVNPNRPPRVLGAESMPPGYERTPGYQAALADLDFEERKAARSAEIRRAMEPPGAALDGYPFAASWSEFLTAIRTNGPAAQAAKRLIHNAMSERVPSEGGFLVPWHLTEQVLAYLTRAIVRPRAMPVAMTGPRVTVPVLDNPSQAASAQALGGLKFSIVEDGKAIPATQPEFGAVALEARKLAAYMTGVPNELLADATPFTESFLPHVIARGLDWLIDDLCIASGTGVGQPQALLNAPGAVSVTRNPPSPFNVGHVDIVTMLKALAPASKANGTWLLSADAFDQLLELYEVIGTAPSGQDIPPPQTLKFNSAARQWELLGLPALPNDHQPAAGTAGDVMLVDFDQYLLGAVEWITIEVSSRGGGFPSDASNIRVRCRLDGRLWPQQSWTTKAATHVSPLVVLH